MLSAEDLEAARDIAALRIKIEVRITTGDITVPEAIIGATIAREVTPVAFRMLLLLSPPTNLLRRLKFINYTNII
jgi:hypothetical protein